jgi:hypothetical protein
VEVKIMRKNLKNVLLVMLVAGLCLAIVGIATADEPSVGKISILPKEPTRQSEVNFSVDVTGDDIEEVYVKVEECVGDPDSPDYFCYAGLLNVSLTGVSGTWEGTGTLQYSNSDDGHCWLVVKSNGIWYDFKNDRTTWTNFTIVPADNGADNNGANGGDSTGKTPGFELILVIVSIVVALFIYKKKRT